MGDAAADAMAACLALHNTQQDCADHIRAQSVNGVFCDGDIVIDASGKRCIPKKVVDAVVAQRTASLGTKFDPVLSAGTTLDTSGAAKVAGALLVGALVIGGFYYFTGST